MIYYRQAGAAILLLAVSGCSFFNPHKTIWENVGFGSREKEYQQSQDQAKLDMPSGVAFADNKTDYPVPKVSKQTKPSSISDLPPDSLAARIYLTKQDPDRLQATPVKHVQAALHSGDSNILKVNSGFQSTWDMTGLAITASQYRLVKTDHKLGVYTIVDPQQLAQSKSKKDATYHVSVESGSQQSIVSVLDQKGKSVPTAQAQIILKALQRQLLALNNSRNPTVPATSWITNDVYGNSNLILNRTVKRSSTIITNALQKSHFVLVNTDVKNKGYLFVDARKTDGKVDKNMPIYILYYRDNGVYSRYYILDSKAKLIANKLAKSFLIAINQAINSR